MNKLVIVVIDALRADFILSSKYDSEFSFIKEQMDHGTAMKFVAKAQTPTVTMPRIKVLLSIFLFSAGGFHVCRCLYLISANRRRFEVEVEGEVQAPAPSSFLERFLLKKFVLFISLSFIASSYYLNLLQRGLLEEMVCGKLHRNLGVWYGIHAGR